MGCKVAGDIGTQPSVLCRVHLTRTRNYRQTRYSGSIFKNRRACDLYLTPFGHTLWKPAWWSNFCYGDEGGVMKVSRTSEWGFFSFCTVHRPLQKPHVSRKIDGNYRIEKGLFQPPYGLARGMLRQLTWPGQQCNRALVNSEKQPCEEAVRIYS